MWLFWNDFKSSSCFCSFAHSSHVVSAQCFLSELGDYNGLSSNYPTTDLNVELSREKLTEMCVSWGHSFSFTCPINNFLYLFFRQIFMRSVCAFIFASSLTITPIFFLLLLNWSQWDQFKSGHVSRNQTHSTAWGMLTSFKKKKKLEKSKTR